MEPCSGPDYHKSQQIYRHVKSNATTVRKSKTLFPVRLVGTNMVWLQPEAVVVQNMGIAFGFNTYIDFEHYVMM